MTKRQTTEIPSEVCDDLAFQRECSSDGHWTKEATVDVDTGRWSSHHQLILQRASDGTFWAVDYSLGLTENQEHDFPWRYRDTVIAYEVHRWAVTVWEYR